MKFVPTAFSFLAVTTAAILSSTTVVVDASSDTDGELTVSRLCKGVHLELNCEWEGNNRRRRLLRTAAAPAAASAAAAAGRRDMTTVELPNHRKLDLELKNVECTASFGDFHYEGDLHFPDDFVVEIREADDVDDLGIFTAKIELAGDDKFAPDIVGEISVELVDTDHGAVYDDSSIGVECP